MIQFNMAQAISRAIFVCALVFSVAGPFLLCKPLQNSDTSTLVPKGRHARNLYQFGYMVECLTNRSAYDFVDYGCWCGWGGNGTAVDGTDRCCEVHDKCYDAVVASGVCLYSFHVYTILYRYNKCHECIPISSYPSEEKTHAACMRAVCECDSAAALCFSLETFNTSYIGYDQSLCV